MKRYRLHFSLGGYEVVDAANPPPWIHSTYRAVVRADVDGGPAPWFQIVHKNALTEIPPPIPAEPEPGAYLIGGQPFIRQTNLDGSVREWLGGGWHVRTWAEVWNVAGGPDVKIVRLVPALPEVELPWTPGVEFSTPIEVGTSRTHVSLRVGSTTVYPDPDLADRAAAALISAARAARSKP